MHASQFLPSVEEVNNEINNLSTDKSLSQHIFEYAKAGNAPMAEALFARVSKKDELDAWARACQGFRLGGFCQTEEKFLKNSFFR